MTQPLRVLLLVNDSCFAHAIALPLFVRHHVVGVVLSRATTGHPERLIKVLGRASWRYLAYRALVQLRRQRVARVARRLGLPVFASYRLSAEHDRLRAFGAGVAVAVNLDQILKPETLTLFPLGVLNAHASRLPEDRGISPALWAFARGDSEVWVTLYRMDAGLDTGRISMSSSRCPSPTRTERSRCISASVRRPASASPRSYHTFISGSHRPRISPG